MLFATDSAPLFDDRDHAGRVLAGALRHVGGPGVVVMGLARGGVQVAAEVARRLEAPLDVVAVRKVGHPWQPEYGLGAVTPGDGVYLREAAGCGGSELRGAIERAQASAARLDRRLHREHQPLDLTGKTVVLVDDGLATGGTMIAAVRWARAAGAARVIAAAPVGAADSLERVAEEADDVVCPHALTPFFAVGVWYVSFDQLDDADVSRLLDDNRRRKGAVMKTIEVTEVLERAGVRFDSLPHERTETALAEARALGVAATAVAKTLVLATPRRHVRAVIPASERLDLRKARRALRLQKADLRLLDEDELARDYPEFELGAVPPLGGAHEDRVLLDRRLADQEQIVLEGGRHDASLRMRTGDLVRLTAAKVADLSQDR